MIDDNFLAELGLGSIPDEEKANMIADIQETLRERVGARVEELLDESKQNEFDQVIDSGDQNATNEWIKNNIPSYQEIISSETSKIKEEIKPQVEGIVQSFSSAPPAI